MLYCDICNNPIAHDAKISFILPKPEDPPEGPIKYLHYPECSTKFLSERDESHIIKGEN